MFEGMGHKASVDYIKVWHTRRAFTRSLVPGRSALLDKGLKNFWGYNCWAF